MSPTITAIVIGAGMLAISAVGSRWWAARPSQRRLIAAVALGIVGALTVWMLAATAGSEPTDAANTALGLLLLLLTVGSILQARRRLESGGR